MVAEAEAAVDMVVIVVVVRVQAVPDMVEGEAMAQAMQQSLAASVAPG